MRLIVFLLLTFMISSCTSFHKSEEIDVIGCVYNSIPKILPPPPIDILPDSIKGKIDVNNRKPLVRKYAINQKFVNDKFGSSISNVFYKYKSGGTESVDSVSWSLAKKLTKQQNTDEDIKQKLLNENLNENIILINQKTIDRDGKLKHKVDGVVSFSKVVFNKDYTKSAVTVAIYSHGLDASLVIYILEKVNGRWVITHREVPTEKT